MKRTVPRLCLTGYTFVEISIAIGVLMIVGGIAYSLLMNSATLLAKNLSLNQSNSILRSALDRIYSEVNQANGLPKLINADGTPLSGSGPAAGIILDRYIGGPYVVSNVSGTGLAAGVTTLKITRSTNALAAPTPSPNDVISMGDGSVRPVVKTFTTATADPSPSPAPNPGQTLTVTLQNPLSAAIPWDSTVKQTATLLHRKAFVVVPVSGRGELRMYGNVENVTNYSDPSGYVVLSREIGMQTQGTEDENKPFKIVSTDESGAVLGASFLRIAMRVEDQQFNKYLATQQAKSFNTFLRVDTLLRPRTIP